MKRPTVFGSGAPAPDPPNSLLFTANNSGIFAVILVPLPAKGEDFYGVEPMRRCFFFGRTAISAATAAPSPPELASGGAVALLVPQRTEAEGAG